MDKSFNRTVAEEPLPRIYVKEAENVVFSCPKESRESMMRILTDRLVNQASTGKGIPVFNPLDAEAALDQALKTF